jgi:hypothetical protein
MCSQGDGKGAEYCSRSKQAMLCMMSSITSNDCRRAMFPETKIYATVVEGLVVWVW